MNLRSCTPTAGLAECKKVVMKKPEKTPLRYPSERMSELIQAFVAGVLKPKTDDRTAIIVGVAMIDTQLEDLLRAFFLPSPDKNEDKLFDSECPLGTFSSRIHLAHRLGIIDTEIGCVLHGIREIRNRFAHDLLACSLNDPPYSDKIRSLAQRYKPLPLVEAMRKAISLPDTPSGTIRVIVTGLSTWLCYLRDGVAKPISAWETPGNTRDHGPFPKDMMKDETDRTDPGAETGGTEPH